MTFFFIFLLNLNTESSSSARLIAALTDPLLGVSAESCAQFKANIVVVVALICEHGVDGSLSGKPFASCLFFWLLFWIVQRGSAMVQEHRAQGLC